MSVIDIKSAREDHSKKAAFDPLPLRDSGHDKLSRTPFYVGFSLAALLVYLKSSVSAKAAAAPVSDAATSDDPSSESGAMGKILPLLSNDERQSQKGSEHAAQAKILPDPDRVDQISTVPLEVLSDRQIARQLKLPVIHGLDFQWGNSGANFAAVAPLQLNDNAGNSTASSRESVSGDIPFSQQRPNRAPIAKEPVVLSDGFSNMAVMIGMADLLKGIVDPDGDQLKIVGIKASDGQVMSIGDDFMFVGDAAGQTTIEYMVTDGKALIEQTATINVAAHATLDGTAQPDTLSGTNQGDFLRGFEGNDKIDAGLGVDTVYAGDGEDAVHGGAGNDLIFGGSGNDTIYGDDGDDVILGGLGNDKIYGGRGNDFLYGQEGNDKLFGDDGDDSLYGDVGDDELSDGKGKDKVFGAIGNDTILADADQEDDTFDGGDGFDTLSYTATTSDITIDIARGTASGVQIGNDGFTQIEALQGGSGHNTFIAAGGEKATTDHVFIGSSGKDTVDYSAATQTLEIDLTTGKAQGVDIGIDGLASIEEVLAGQADDSILGSAGNDQISAGRGNDVVYGDAGNDDISGDDGDDFLFGDEGDDTISDGQGRDFVEAGSGNDHIIAATDKTDDAFDGGDGEDRISYATVRTAITFDLLEETASGRDVGTDAIANIETLEGGSGDDVFVVAGGEAARADQTFIGNNGKDVLDFGNAIEDLEIDLTLGIARGEEIGTDSFSAIEKVIAGSGDDYFVVGSAPAVLAGGFGDDVFEFIDDGNGASGRTRHVIEDFDVGDIVRMSDFDIFEQEFVPEFLEQFNTSFQWQTTDDQVPFRFRQIAGGTKTLIEADIDHDYTFEFAIELDGIHHLLVNHTLHI